jgi:hypothetical protein
VIAASVAGVISAAVVAGTLRNLLRLGRLRPTGRGALAEAVRSAERGDVERALDALFPTGWSPAMCDALVLGEPLPAAVAELNEQLGDIDRELSAADGVSKSAVRIPLFAGSFGAIVELLPTVGVPLPDYAPAIAAVGFGIIGAAIGGELGRRTRDRVGDLRTEWDQVASVFSRRFGIAQQR